MAFDPDKLKVLMVSDVDTEKDNVQVEIFRYGNSQPKVRFVNTGSYPIRSIPVDEWENYVSATEAAIDQARKEGRL